VPSEDSKIRRLPGDAEQVQPLLSQWPEVLVGERYRRRRFRRRRGVSIMQV